jgi:hypothetical protein
LLSEIYPVLKTIITVEFGQGSGEAVLCFFSTAHDKFVFFIALIKLIGQKKNRHTQQAKNSNINGCHSLTFFSIGHEPVNHFDIFGEIFISK